jgi:alkylated DNA repair dioxygenase AlkB
MTELTLFNNLPKDNIENNIKLLKNCKKLCKKLKEVYDTQKEEDFIKKLKMVKSYYLSVLHFYCLYCKEIDKEINEDEEHFYSILLHFLSIIFFKPFKGTVTLTFGDVAESHFGMQNIGKKSKNGFSLHDIRKAEQFFIKKGCKTMIICLNDFLPSEAESEEKTYLNIAKKEEEFQAYLLVIRGGLGALINDEKGIELTTETQFFSWDTKMYNVNKNKVLNKNARHNLNFSYEKQESDFENGKGTTVPWEEVPLIYKTRQELYHAFGEVGKDLQCEGNLYYDSGKTGIGYHGDTERRKVIGVRLGKPMSMHFQWYYNDRPRSVNISLILQPGDVYCMTEKTVGTDWRPKLSEGIFKKRYVLRHAAGAKNYTTQTQKLVITNIRPTPLYEGVMIGDVTFKEKNKKSKQSDSD